MKNHIIPAIILTICCIVFFSGVYTLVVWGVAQFAPNSGKGETIGYGNGSYGFANVGQTFTQDKYFWSRPSAVNYNAASSAGSNKGPSNPDYLAQVHARIDTFLVHNPGIDKGEIPADLVTASGSGLDPDISVEAAKIQINRIARVRKMDPESLKALVNNHIENRWYDIYGPKRVNVLSLNIALDGLK